MTVEAAQMLFYRVGLVGVLCMGFVEAWRAIRHGGLAHPHGLVRIQRVRLLVSGPYARLGLAVLFAAASGAFVLKLAPAAAAVVLALTFTLTVSLYVSLEISGYVAHGKGGRVERHIFHHLHLAGLCIAGAAAGELYVLVADIPRDTLFGLDAGDAYVLHAIWACIGAHYFIAGVNKVALRGGSWADRRLFPFYITLLCAFHLGDTGRWVRQPLPDLLIRWPTLGLTVLWAVLGLELSAVLYPFDSAFRALIGSALIGFHLLALGTLHVDFRENTLLLAIFSFQPVVLIASLPFSATA